MYATLAAAKRKPEKHSTVQLVEHCTGIVEVGAWNPVQACSGRLHDCVGLSFDSFISVHIYQFHITQLTNLYCPSLEQRT